MIIYWKFFYIPVCENFEMYFKAGGLNSVPRTRRGGINRHAIPAKLGKICSRKTLLLGHINYNLISDTRKLFI
jgi:hypothetical protein